MDVRKDNDVGLGMIVDAKRNLPLLPGVNLVVFLRHLGCPFAEDTVRRLFRLRMSGTQPLVLHVIVVSQGDDAVTTRWLKRTVPGADFLVVPDPSCSLYAAWGIGRTSLLHFLGPSTVLGVVRLWFQGIFHGTTVGSRAQGAASFLIHKQGDKSTIVWRHAPSHAADVPDYAEVLAARLHSAF